MEHAANSSPCPLCFTAAGAGSRQGHRCCYDGGGGALSGGVAALVSRNLGGCLAGVARGTAWVPLAFAAVPARSPPGHGLEVGRTMRRWVERRRLGGSVCGSGGTQLGRRSTIVVDGCWCDDGNGWIWMRGGE